MRFGLFLKEKRYFILPFFLVFFLTSILLIVFQIPVIVFILFSFFFFSFFVWTLTFEYTRKYRFYQELLGHIKELDQAYYVLETLEEPNFYEGELTYQALYEINKSMSEYTRRINYQLEDFKEYIEMWIHEVKIPIASLLLFSHNHKKTLDKRVVEQLKRIDDQVEQVLYYVRCENAEKDYLIKEVSVKKMISSVALRNQNDLLENKINLKVNTKDCFVLTDSKWLEFILNQIISNSIKYKKEKGSSFIKIDVKEEGSDVFLIIEDNGIGIKNEDLPRVFDKTFTGSNGRRKASSTGMGLFIVKNLCEKLGHKIEIESVLDSYTRVTITISKDSFYYEAL